MALFCAFSGTALAALSYAVTRHAQSKRRQAVSVENALSISPTILFQQFKKSNSSSDFHRYVALEGKINVAPDAVPVQYQNKDVAYFNRQMTDRLYSCKFVVDRTRTRTRRQNNNQDREEANTHEDESRRRMSNDMPDAPRGKVECTEKWDIINKKSTMSLSTLYLESHDNATPVVVSSSKSSTSSTSSTTPKILIEGVTVKDMEASKKEMVNTFHPAHTDPATITMQKNQHQLIVLSAAGNNIVLNDLQPVTTGTREVVHGVECGDSLICIGHVSVDEKTGELQISRRSRRPSSSSSLLMKDYPFVLSRQNKMEVSQDLKNEATQMDLASTILGVSAGGLLAAGVGLGVMQMQK